MSTNNSNTENFSADQKEYIEGLFAGIKIKGQAFSDVEDGTKPKKQTKEEKIKSDQHPFDAYSELRRKAKEKLPPEPEDIFRFKWNGLFWLAPVHDGYMCRLRIPGGFLKANQFRELGSVATDLASGFLQVTTRNNLQIRIIPPEHTTELLRRVVDCGLHSRGTGADNIRNITANPTTGIDPHELIDVKPLVEDLQAVIMNDIEFYDLPRKYNISFHGGGLVPVAEDTNDIGLRAFKKSEKVYFQILLGGVTGHQEFAEYSGVVCEPKDAVEITAIMTKIFARNGSRKSRGKSRLIYLLKDWGFEKFIEETEKELGYKLERLGEDEIPVHEATLPDVPHAHLGVHEQSQEGYSYVGVSTPVGLIQADEIEAIANVAEKYGTGELRLTIFQNVIIPHVENKNTDKAVKELEEAGLVTKQSQFRGGTVACTGNRYCKYSSADTKGHAVALGEYIDTKLELDQPINVHVTGCPHSCAQHYVGDIGLLGCKVDQDGEAVEGFHVFVGGGFGKAKNFGRQLFQSVTAGDELNHKVHGLLAGYLKEREGKQSFQEYTTSKSIEDLQGISEKYTETVAI